jgi:Leucine-rich repeat (LRR) protein
MKEVVDNVPVNQPTLQYMEFTASAGTDTRTQLTSDNKVVWQAGDAISIFDGTGNRKFTTKDSGASAIFGGNAASATDYYALYPYQEGATLSGNVIKGVTLPAEQTAKAGSFDAAYNLSVAKASSDLQLAFKNVGSLVKFAVSNDQAANVRKVKLTSHDATAVLTATVDITLGSLPAVTPTSGQLPSATLIADNGLETGKYYYFAVLPSELSTGFSLTFFDEQGNTWQKDYTKEANLNRSNILKLAAIEVGAFTNSLLTNANLIAAAEESTGRTFTKNADGSVSLLNDDNYQIVMAVTRIDVDSKEDPSVCEEIGVFINLEYLNCSSNGITSLDLSKNTELITLWCGGNQLTSLNLTNNAALTELWCYGNQLTSLDLSKNTALTGLDCGGNQLTSLDLSKNTALTFVDCNYNQLTSLNLANNTELINLACPNNQLTNLNLVNNTELINLDCTNNQLTNLDVSNNTALTTLNCSWNGLTSLDLSKNTALTELYCGANQLTNLDVSNNTALTELDCGINTLTNLDISKNTALTELGCAMNQLTSLDVSKNTALTHLDCNSNQLTSLDLTNNTALTTCLICHSNHLKSLDISNHNQLDWGNLYVGLQRDSTTGEDQELTLYVNADQISQELQSLDGVNKNVNKLLKSDATHEDYSETDY